MSHSFDLPALESRLRAHVEQLAKTPRPPDTPEHRQAADYIQEHLKQAGFAPRPVTYREAGYECINLVTDPQPAAADVPLLIVGAHYDSVSNSPGADDNGSAVAALIELAHWIQPRLGPAAVRLQLAAYDLEEYGMIGSYLHARELNQSKTTIAGMISLEMLGYTDHRPGSQQMPPHLVGLYPEVANFIGVCANERSVELLQTVVASMKTVKGLPIEHITVPGNGEAFYQVRLSDHSSFWDMNYPALMITDTSFFRNPHYHQATDTPETLDYRFLARVTAGACTAVERLLRV